jgi:hypothetical protein
LRFRTPGHFALDGETASSTIGGTKLVIANLGRTSGKATIGVPTLKDCFKEGTVRGTCDAARFPVTDYRVVVAGPKPRAVHVISAVAANPAIATALSGSDWAGVKLGGVRDAVVVWRTEGSGTLTYQVPRGKAVTHVVLDATSLTAKRDGDTCVVEGTAGSGPAIVTLDQDCNVTIDPEAPAASATNTKATGTRVHSPRSGCCGAQATPTSPIAMALVVGLVLLRRRAVRQRSARASR